jgi:hypothetical protein
VSSLHPSQTFFDCRNRSQNSGRCTASQSQVPLLMLMPHCITQLHIGPRWDWPWALAWESRCTGQPDGSAPWWDRQFLTESSSSADTGVGSSGLGHLGWLPVSRRVLNFAHYVDLLHIFLSIPWAPIHPLNTSLTDEDLRLIWQVMLAWHSHVKTHTALW